MGDVAHTAGPWAVAKGSDQYISAEGVWIASTMGTRGETGAANARLIAAAPELLEVLEAFVAAFEREQDYFGDEFAKGQAAISKARGLTERTKGSEQ